MGAERVGEMALRDAFGGGLGREDGNLELLGQVLHGAHDGAVELSDHRDDPVLRRELAEPGSALFRRARVVLDDQLDLSAAEHAAPGVDVVGRHLRAPDDELSGGGVAGRRQRRQHADLDGALREDRRHGGEKENRRTQRDHAGQPGTLSHVPSPFVHSLRAASSTSTPSPGPSSARIAPSP